ncbi:MAG: MbcA/ParS/Xre antitoxin family protein [Pseudomonadota bacterium]|nr:MbcA/ParS/Xre antitoxin family protein [Pseudomonadota bacterium]
MIQLEAQATRPFAFMELFRASPVDRVDFIKQGVSAQTLKHFISALHVDQKIMFDALNLKVATVNKKAAKNQPLSTEESERIIGLAKLVGQLEAMVEESGDPEGFDAPGWLSTWLREPLPAFGGVKPISLLDTMEGQAMVAKALAQINSGAFS